MDENSTPYYPNMDLNSAQLLDFCGFASNDFFDAYGLSPSPDSVNNLKRMAREIMMGA